jgi:lipid A 3-O-deacylase
MFYSYKKNLLVGLAALAWACTTPLAHAEDGTQGGIGLHYGFGDRFDRINLQYETPSLWTFGFGGNWGRLDITPEIGVAYWWAHGEDKPSSVWQFNAIPMFRWWVGSGERFYLEAGVGPTFFSRVAFAGKYYSTSFQFGDHVGFGYLLDEHNRIGVRISHFSNASIKTPNPGMNLIQATYTYQF